MPQRTRIEALRVIFECAVLYNDNLAGKNVLFITTTPDNKTAGFETLFMPHNFLHLTGISTKHNAELFFRAALNRRLSVNDISLALDGTTDLKLDILSKLMSIHMTARMIGDYDNSKPLLITDKFAGTIAMAMGFTQINGFYMPNTALKMDLRQITEQATRRKVAAIFIKPRNADYYKRLTYIAKGMTIDDAVLALIIQEKVDITNLTADFPIPISNEA